MHAVAGFSDVSVQSLSAVRATEDQSITGQLNLISVLLVLAIVVALLGIVNTLALSVVERHASWPCCAPLACLGSRSARWCRRSPR